MTTIKKSDDDQQMVWGAVYVPNSLDSQGDFMNAEEIQKMAYNFVKKGDMGAIDVQHDNERVSAFVVESFLTRKGDPDFTTEGTWVVGVHIEDGDLWEAVKKGDINGFSMEALVKTSFEYLEVKDKPSAIVGLTKIAKSDEIALHDHEFEAFYDEAGNFMGGRTSLHTDESGNTHFHVIQKGVVTETSLDHAHRFEQITEMV